MRGDMRDDSAEILLQSFLLEAPVSSSCMNRAVQSLMLSVQHFLCLPRRCPPSQVPCRMVSERLSWRETCSNHASPGMSHAMTAWFGAGNMQPFRNTVSLVGKY